MKCKANCAENKLTISRITGTCFGLAVAILFVSLLMISMFSILAPSGSAANYTLIVDAATEDTDITVTCSKESILPVGRNRNYIDCSDSGSINPSSLFFLKGRFAGSTRRRRVHH